MNAVCPLFLLFSIAAASDNTSSSTIENNEVCASRALHQPVPPTGLTFDVSVTINDILGEIQLTPANFSSISRRLLTSSREIAGVILSSATNYPLLALSYKGGIKLVYNRTEDTEMFWKTFDSAQLNGWAPPFRECRFLPKIWLHAYVLKKTDVGLALFIPMKINQCDALYGLYLGDAHKCDRKTTRCEPLQEYGERRGGYRCVCRNGYYYPGANISWRGFSGEDIENGLIATHSCKLCPKDCDMCGVGGACDADRNIHLRTIILSVQLACMGMTVIVALVVFRQRKCKTIASGMWTVLETTLLGIFLLYATVVIQFFEPSVIQCIAEPWSRELGFIVCYGAIILKLYRHLMEFRTRKAHRWVIKDTDLLKYLLIMVLSVFAYMSAYTSISLNFVQENYSLLYVRQTTDGVTYQACKPLWWDYVTEAGEMTILCFGIHLSIGSRNARTPFNERIYLCASIAIELIVSLVFYAVRIIVMPDLHPDMVLLTYFVRSHTTTTLTLILVFGPKFWYQQKQARSLAQDYSCRIPVDAFKHEANAHGPLASNNSDVDVGEVTLADMSPDDIRAELKRLYMQLEIFKNKTICRDNPHISKRRGGKKAQHRRFSLQNLYGKHRKHVEQDMNEPEPSRTPEDSVCSTEGPSGIYSDLPSTHTDQRQ